MSATVMSASGIESMGNVNYGADKIQSPLDCNNSLDEPEHIVPRTVESKVTSPRVEVEIPACPKTLVITDLLTERKSVAYLYNLNTP